METYTSNLFHISVTRWLLNYLYQTIHCDRNNFDKGPGSRRLNTRIQIPMFLIDKEVKPTGTRGIFLLVLILICILPYITYLYIHVRSCFCIPCRRIPLLTCQAKHTLSEFAIASQPGTLENNQSVATNWLVNHHYCNHGDTPHDSARAIGSKVSDGRVYKLQCLSVHFNGRYSSTTEPSSTIQYSPNQSIHLIHELRHPILLIKVPAAVFADDQNVSLLNFTIIHEYIIFSHSFSIRFAHQKKWLLWLQSMKWWQRYIPLSAGRALITTASDFIQECQYHH
jgi:hypothetical protein